MEASEWDHTTLREEEFEQHAVYLVPDVSAPPNDPNRAEGSLPRNLVLKPSQAPNDVSLFLFHLQYLFSSFCPTNNKFNKIIHLKLVVS